MDLKVWRAKLFTVLFLGMFPYVPPYKYHLPALRFTSSSLLCPKYCVCFLTFFQLKFPELVKITMHRPFTGNNVATFHPFCLSYFLSPPIGHQIIFCITPDMQWFIQSQQHCDMLPHTLLQNLLCTVSHSLQGNKEYLHFQWNTKPPKPLDLEGC